MVRNNAPEKCSGWSIIPEHFPENAPENVHLSGKMLRKNAHLSGKCSGKCSFIRKMLRKMLIYPENAPGKSSFIRKMLRKNAPENAHLFRNNAPGNAHLFLAISHGMPQGCSVMSGETVNDWIYIEWVNDPSLQMWTLIKRPFTRGPGTQPGSRNGP